jgi:hypothetical protein
MKSLARRIVVHGLMAAVPLALLGFLYAQMAGMWTATQSPLRIGPASEEVVAVRNSDADGVTAALEWKVPIVMATGGFLFVAIGECLLAMWRRPGNPPTPSRSNSPS